MKMLIWTSLALALSLAAPIRATAAEGKQEKNKKTEGASDDGLFTKAAVFGTIRSAVMEGGTFGHKRASADLNTALSSTVAVRFNAVYENSDSFRADVGLKRYGASPTLTFAPSERTTVSVGYEYWHDDRVADRGVTSFHGAPVDVP